MHKRLKKFHPIRQMMANKYDAMQFDMAMAIRQKDRSMAQINTYGRKFPQSIAKRELLHMWKVMFPR